MTWWCCKQEYPHHEISCKNYKPEEDSIESIRKQAAREIVGIISECHAVIDWCNSEVCPRKPFIDAIKEHFNLDKETGK